MASLSVPAEKKQSRLPFPFILRRAERKEGARRARRKMQRPGALCVQPLGPQRGFLTCWRLLCMQFVCSADC